MGLDSVELVIEFEKYFKLNIPDREAENMYRVSDVVRYLNAIYTTTASDPEPVFSLLQNKFADLLNLGLEDPVFEKYKVESKAFWQQVAVATDLKIVLPESSATKDLNMLQRLFYPEPDYVATQITYERFLEVTAYVNYKVLAGPGQWNTLEALTIAVCGITIELNSLDPYKVYPSSRFVDDLGIN